MIIKASKEDREFLKEQLLKLIKENESDLSRATDEDIQQGIETFDERFSIRRALLKRAINIIRETKQERWCELNRATCANEHWQHEYLARQDEQEKEDKLDSIGPELLDITSDDDLPF